MSPENILKLKALLIQQEGMKLFPYMDTTGNITIGAGRNLTARGISNAEALGLLDDDMAYFIEHLPNALPWCLKLGDARFSGLVSIAFNNGMARLMDFHQMLDALETGQWQKAHDECLSSIQAPTRYNQIAAIFLTGQL